MLLAAAAANDSMVSLSMARMSCQGHCFLVNWPSVAGTTSDPFSPFDAWLHSWVVGKVLCGTGQASPVCDFFIFILQSVSNTITVAYRPVCKVVNSWKGDSQATAPIGRKASTNVMACFGI